MTKLDKVLQAIGTCREEGTSTISTCNHSNWNQEEHKDMLMLQANPPADIRVDLKATHGVCDWTLIRIGDQAGKQEPAYQAAERPTLKTNAMMDAEKQNFTVFGAYQHFLYNFDQNHFEANSPFDQHMTSHFINKLNGFSMIEGYNSVPVLATWIQNMSKNNQAIMLGYILKHHSNKW